jgi:threonine synthase
LRQFRGSGALPEDEQAWRAARALFSGHRADDRATLDTIADTYRRTGLLIDPHTAVAVAAARAEMARSEMARSEMARAEAAEAERTTPIIALATAHPAKFPDAVARATGIRPPPPAALAEIIGKPERFTVLPNDANAVARYVHAHARRGEAGGITSRGVA